MKRELLSIVLRHAAI